ncbi:hypothetical protein BN946_scf184654.g3 [Trametes cinnabarina]|uniref:Fungal-type protein kinase domain-containing protein n=1 Tax=Pycnoporus cinnabarinus TaxID=5643 RepID=A0A060SLQ4_PYCCI|nr:hypothetical protein BN946_scf184654.g3 [Trametes cinnabarina]
MPHICCFTPDNASIVRDANPRSFLEFAYAELFIQVASDPAANYFIDLGFEATAENPAHDLLREIEDDHAREEAERSHGLNIAYATEILARQHRLFLFSISMAGFSQLPISKRGLDATIQIASLPEEAMFRSAIREHVQSQLEIEGDELEDALSAHYLPGHVTVIPVTPRQPCTSSATRRFIVSRPIVSPVSLVGRGTRGFWAVDADTSQVVFLKDCWRYYWAPEVEGDILRRLNNLGVRNIPSLTTHGDVPMEAGEDLEASEQTYQSTLTEAFMEDPWVCTVGGTKVNVNELWHYRLVISVAGYSLRSLRGTEELLYATHDALVAMKDALLKDSRIHRDLSVGNIILVKEPDRAVRKGYLIDWEASDRIDDAGAALHSGRAMDGKHTLVDDLEALLYVVLYCALFYLPHNLSAQDLSHFKEAFFDGSMYWPGGVMHGGIAKLANAHTRFYTEEVHFGSAALEEWLRTVMDLHCPHLGSHVPDEKTWTLDNLDAYWTEFLSTHNLERNNRQEHKLPMNTTVTSHSTSSSSSPNVSLLPRKRRVNEIGPEEEEPRKTVRSSSRTGAEPSTTRPRSAADDIFKSSTSVALRRSERLRARREVSKQSVGPVSDGGRVTIHNKASRRPTTRKGRGGRTRK